MLTTSFWRVLFKKTVGRGFARPGRGGVRFLSSVVEYGLDPWGETTS